LRGIALFGVLIINLVMEFRVSIFEQFLNQPSIRGPLDPILDTLLLLLFSQKALALFRYCLGLDLQSNSTGYAKIRVASGCCCAG